MRVVGTSSWSRSSPRSNARHMQFLALAGRWLDCCLGRRSLMPARAAFRLVTLGVAGVAFACAVARSTYVGTASDTAAYVAISEMWRRSELVRPSPLQLLGGVPRREGASTALGLRPGMQSGTDVPAYPAGWPMLMASAWAATGTPLSAYVVTPALYGLLLATAAALANYRCASAAPGLFAAAILAGMPALFFSAIEPMSDVPAAALWTLSWYLALSETSSAGLAAGACVALAILIRPNLAPLAFVPLGLLLRPAFQRPRRAAPALAFTAMASAGVGLLLALQSVVYGSWSESAYPGASGFFALKHVGINLQNYSRMLAAQFGLPTIMVLAAGAFASLRWPDRADPVARAGASFVLLNAMLYVAYLPMDQWPFIRFLYPGIVGVAVIAARGWYRIALIGTMSRYAVVLACCLAAGTSAAMRPDLWGYSWRAWIDYQRVLQMREYVDAAFPPNAVVLGFVHTGVLSHGGRRSIVRLDKIEPGELEATVRNLEASGLIPYFVLDSEIEYAAFRSRFADSQYGDLDWAPRARFVSAFESACWRASDKSAAASYRTDVLRTSVSRKTIW